MRTPCPVRPSACAARVLVKAKWASTAGWAGFGAGGGVGGGVAGGGVGRTASPPPPPPPQALRMARLSAHSASRELHRAAGPNRFIAQLPVGDGPPLAPLRHGRAS